MHASALATVLLWELETQLMAALKAMQQMFSLCVVVLIYSKITFVALLGSVPFQLVHLVLGMLNLRSKTKST